MTRKERLEAVIGGRITKELVEDCKRELKKLNAESARAKEKAMDSDRVRENNVVAKAIIDYLKEVGTPTLVDELRLEVGNGLSRQKITSICTNLVRDEAIFVTDIKIKGKGYRRAYYV